MELTPQRGAIPVTLDRPRILHFDLRATFALQQKYGGHPLSKLYAPKGDGVELLDPDALVYFVWAGLQREAKASGETLTLERVDELMGIWNYREIFPAVLLAVTGATRTPPGKQSATGAPAKPAVVAKAAKHPSRKASTSTKHSAGPTAKRATRRKSSGR